MSRGVVSIRSTEGSVNPLSQVSLYVRGIGTVILPWWPEDISLSGGTNSYDEQARPSRKPLLLLDGIDLEELRIGCMVSLRDAVGPEGMARANEVVAVLTGLRAMSVSLVPVQVKLASRGGLYRITDLGVTELDWDSGGNPIAAEVSFTLREASQAVIPVGPIRGKGR